MKDTLEINQFGICNLADELGLDLSSINLEALAFLDYLVFLNGLKNRLECTRNGKTYLCVNYNEAILANPILFLNKNKITRLFKQLRQWGLVETIQDSIGCLFFAFGANYSKLALKD